jgi:TusA-related sulfurtransferase
MTHQPTEHLDLRGVACPENARRVLFAMELMEPGELIEVLVDRGEPATNVPESMEFEGHELLERELHEAHARLLLRRGE